MREAILVVEDHRVIREGMIQLLNREGFVGVPAANGQEALDYFRAGGHATVIVLDLSMPVMNGWTFRRVQNGDPALAAIPTIILSGINSAPFEDDCPAAVLAKPVDPQQLLTLLHTLCEDGH